MISQDDFDGIKNQIHNKINQIDEAVGREDSDVEETGGNGSEPAHSALKRPDSDDVNSQPDDEG